jgi:hypothetical protein
MKAVTRWLGLAVSLVLTAVVAVSWAPAASSKTMLENEFGALKVRKVTGESVNGAQFEGFYDVRRFKATKNSVKAVGVLTGTLTRPNGKTKAVSERVKMPVDLAASASRNQGSSDGVSTMAVCDVLRLVLGPLSIDLLGLQIDLNRVVLTIDAVTGAGNLLGNLLCAVAGLLDGVGLGGLTDILEDLLNAVIGILRS